MPLKTNIGVNRKVADNNYGSRGCSVNLEVELDSSLIQEPERLQERIRQVFRLAQQSVDEELNRQQGNSTASRQTTGAATGPVAEPPHGNGNGANGNGQRSGSSHPISEKQLTFIHQLAGSVRGLGVRRLDSLTAKMFNKPSADLSSLDGSGLIDTLKSIKDGTISLDVALEGTAA